MTETFNDPVEFFNYVILNKTLNQYDTISDITFEEEFRESTCNECTDGLFCKDDVYMSRTFVNARLRFNGELIEGFNIIYRKK